MNIIEKKRIVKDRSFHISKPPVKVLPIAEDLGLEVYSIKKWDDNISGMIIKNGASKKSKSGYSIYVNANHSDTRRRFTIAHEIAHFVLHESLIGDGIKEDALYRSGLSSIIESEANQYAADILMPKSLILKAIQKEVSLEKLAEIFFVSPQAMAIRLQIVQD